ncbi:hypothetical protein EON73_01410, partial [bacterium]
NNEKISFLGDTQADISVIKISAIKTNALYDSNERIFIKGVTNEHIESIGTIIFDIIIENVAIEHKFHIVHDDFAIPSHGILGKDFIKKHRCLLDYENMIFELRLDNMTVSTPIYAEYIDNTITMPPRTEMFRLFHINANKFPVIIENCEISNNVFIPTTIAHTEKTWVRVLNANDQIKTIKTNELNGFPIENYDIYKPITSENDEIHKSRIKKFEKILKIPKHARHKLLPLCLKYADIFHVDGDKQTVNNFYKQKLNVKDNEPVFTKNYRLPHSQKSEIKSQVQKLLENDLIEMSTSPYNSPLIIVPKKSTDGTKKYRMCVDYRKLNKKLVPDKHPLPRIDDILEGLGRARYFSVCDLYAGYHQIPLEEESRPLSSFCTDNGFFQWKVLPFGLNIAPSSFTRMMSIAFSGLSPDKAFIYMDDLIVIGFTENQHVNNLENVFKTCRKFNLKLNPEKCAFFRHEVYFLGHKCTRDGLLPDPAKTHAIQNYERPKNKDAVKRFVAFANYYRRFIKNFAGIARPLSQLTGKKVEFIWTDECEKAFQKLKQSLISVEVLAYPDFTKPFIVTVDASQFACGAVLSQEINGIDRPVQFISKTFKKGERNKPIIEKELLAIHFAITTLRPYLYGTKFVVYSDHKPLIYLYSLKNPASKLTRIRLDLEEYNFVVQYIKGANNVVADALSRISIQDLKESIEDCSEEPKIDQSKINTPKKVLKMSAKSSKKRSVNKILAITRSMSRNMSKLVPKTPFKAVEELQSQNNFKAYEMQRQRNAFRPRIRTTKINEEIREIELKIFYKRRQIIKISLANCTIEKLLKLIEKEARAIEINELEWPLHDAIFKTCSIEDFKNACNQSLIELRIILLDTPEKIENNEEKVKIIEKFHNDKLFGGHQNSKKLYAAIRDRYYWKSMLKDIVKYTENCEICKKNKMLTRTKEQMILTKTPQKSFELVIIDTIGPITQKDGSKINIVTMICDLTKYLVCAPVPDKSAKEVAKAIFEHFILIYGPMKEIRSDRGTEYINQVIQELCKLLKIDHKSSTAHHHESVGTIERNHKEFNKYIRIYFENNNEDWKTYIKYFTFCYNIAKNGSNNLNYSPYELVFAKKPIIPPDILNGRIDPIYNIDNYISEARYRLQVAHKKVQQLLDKMKTYNKTQYDKKSNPIDVKINDKVYLEKMPYNKHQPIYEGPYAIVDIDHPNVKLQVGKKVEVVHKNRIVKK